MRVRSFFTMFAFIMVSSVIAQPAYDDSPFGINGLKLIHGREDPNVWVNAVKTAKVMRDAGIKWDRLELWWSVIEPEKGKFDWSFADKAARFYKQQGIKAMVILCYSSAWSKGKPPTDAVERARYANYVYKVVSRYKDTYKVWEIWNEPNIPTFWDKPDVKQYTLLLKDAYKAAKRADPTCLVLAGCTSGADLGFIKGIKKYGGWDYCDGISIHPYSMSGGPITQQLDRILRITQSVISESGKRKELWITEMGWTTHVPSMNDAQAVYLFQSYVIALANNVKKLFWFDLVDWAEKWGIVRSIEPFNPKPAYRAYKTLVRNLDGMVFEGYLKMPISVSCYVFKPKQYTSNIQHRRYERLLVLWSNDGYKHEVALSVDAKSTAWDIMGGKVEIKPSKIPVGNVPIMLVVPDIRKVGSVSTSYNPYLERERGNLILNGTLNEIRESRPWCWSVGRFDGTAKDGKFAVSVKGWQNSKCVSISKSDKRAAWEAFMVPVISGKRYVLSAWVRAKEATGRNYISLLWYSGNMWTYQGEVCSDSIAGTCEWKKVTVCGVAPPEATFVRVNLVSENNSGTVWFDEVFLREQ
jgi:hypothetical protein